MAIADKIKALREELPEGVVLVAVSKTHPSDAVMEAYGAGQRIFGESRPQELRTKFEELPKDIRWHMIGHLQTNKVKYIAPFVELIHSVDSDKLLAVIDREAARCGRVIDVLLEVHLAAEQTKSGWDEDELAEYISTGKHLVYKNVRIRGLMAIATLTEDMDRVSAEFGRLREIFDRMRIPCFGPEFDILSMGMTSDYHAAIANGSTMVRIGSLIFGER